MRNPERLDSFYITLKEIHQTKLPDWRFGQFMINFFQWHLAVYGTDCFYLEEDRFLERIYQYVRILLLEDD